MDLVSSSKDKLTYFRLKELKDVLSQLGLPKQGKKQDLVHRIYALLSDEPVSRALSWGKKNSIGKEGVAKIIDDTYRKMQVPCATDLASKSHSGSDLNLVMAKEEVQDYYDIKVRCPCGSSLITESMLKCEDPRCQVWQHIACVIIPEKPMEGVQPELPDKFYCDICRINRADPFWVTVGQPLLPLLLTSSGTAAAADVTVTVQNMDKTFQLIRADREMLQRTEYDLQVWCILLNDKVPFRMQWPQHPELQVNGVPLRVTNRPGTQLLGINGRDDCAIITTCSREGVNKISFSRTDARVFCFGIRIAKRRTFQQVLSLVPKEADGERFEDALARVRRCIGGGAATENSGGDSDLEVVADSVTVNLRCPNSATRIRIAGRFKPCAHMGCFDLEAFVELNQRSRKWQCPICLKNYAPESVIIDPYFNRITSLMRNCGEDVNEIDIKPDGCWRAKNEGECSDLAQWHLPDGSLSPTTDGDVKPNAETLRQIKQEGTSEGHGGLKLGIKRNRNGMWEVSKPEYMRPPSPGNHVPERFENNWQNTMLMSSSASGEGEDPSVNQGGGHFDFSINNGHELDSISLDFDPTYDIEDGIPPKDTDVIVLSDSEDENLAIISPDIVYDAGPASGNPFSDDPGLGASGTSLIDPFGNDSNDLPLWQMQAGSGFQLFGTDADNPDATATPVGGYGGDQLHELTNTEADGSLVDNPLSFMREDPAFRIFLPSRSATGVPLQSNVGEPTELPNGDQPDDWISLSLAAGGDHANPTHSNGLNSRQQENKMESLADASLLLSMRDEDRSKKSTSTTQRSDNAFSNVPRQPRSVRPRLYLSIDTDSD